MLTIQELDLSSNKFKRIPDEFATAFRALRKLNLSDNQLVNLPVNFGSLSQLEEIDLRGNPKLGRLSEALLCCPNLRIVLLDEFHPDSKAFAAALSPNNQVTNSAKASSTISNSASQSQSQSVTSSRDVPDAPSEAFLRYEREREAKQRVLIEQEAERQRSEAKKNQVNLDYATRDLQRAALVQELLLEEQRASAEMNKLMEVKRDERARFFNRITHEEATVRSLIDRILLANEAARRSDQAAADAEERAFYANAARYALLNVRRDEVVARMRAELERSEKLADLLEHRARKDQADALKTVLSHAERESYAVDAVLNQRDQSHTHLVNVLIEDVRSFSFSVFLLHYYLVIVQLVRVSHAIVFSK